MIALEYIVSSLLMCLTIIGIPFGIQTFKLAGLALWPFGSDVICNEERQSGCLNAILTLVWWLVGGMAIAFTHLAWGIIFGITIVGIPFARQHFKLMCLALFPFGKNVVKTGIR